MSEGWSVWKDIAYPGRVHVPGPKGTHVYDFTGRDMAALEQSGNAKVGDGWNIPVCWEHQDVGPARLSQSDNPLRDFATGVFARIRRFSRTPDGRLKALIAGTDPADLEQLKKVGFVSPEIAWDWTDTDGRVWRGPSVTHLAATARPVQRHQHPIGSDPDKPHPGLAPAARADSLESLVRMSFSGGAKRPRVAATLRLSIDHYGGARDMADETDTPDAGPDKKLSPWEKIAQALSQHCGIQLGDVSAINTPEEFARLVEVAAMNYKAGSEPEVPEEDDDEAPPENPEGAEAPPGDMEQPPAGAQEAPNPPVQMSVTAQNKAIADRLIAAERAGLVRRADKVRKSGALQPGDADALVEECRTVRLSLTDKGELIPNDTTKALARLEKVKPGTVVNLGGPRAKKKVQLSQGKPRAAVPVEDSPFREDPQQDADQIADAWDAT